ncbi:MAG: amino acid adenylation domain-containing protein [Planctomycetales bacterium]
MYDAAHATESVALHHKFELQAANRPQAPAVVCGGSTLTYGELNGRANRLAHLLRELGVIPDRLVGLCLGRTGDLVIGQLGIVKAGGAYVPIDPGYPPERLKLLCDDSGVDIVVCDRSTRDRLTDFSGRLVDLDADADRLGGQPDCNLDHNVAGENLLYVIYTSGSTGRPKGVLVTHRNVVRLFRRLREVMVFSEADSWSMFHSAAFGFSVWEIWGALLHGARLVIVPADVAASPPALCDLLRAQSISVLSQTPSAFRQLLTCEQFNPSGPRWKLRRIALSGEPLPARDVRTWFENPGSRNVELWDTYAITEAGGQVSCRLITPESATSGLSPRLGTLLSDTRVDILDDRLQPVAEGEVGELCVTGPGVARGYLRRPELSAERFVESPMHPGERMYRTGDLARRTAAGEIELAGRADQQVKIRGHRVEPGEIESALREHPGVGDAAVVPLTDDQGNQRLVAYVVEQPVAVVGAERPSIDRESNSQAEFWPSLGEYQIYDPFLYHLMTRETVRNARYQEAIDRHVRGKVVLDIGTGQDAILAQFCAAAGARHVYAVEVLEDAAARAAALVERLGLSDRITVIHGDALSIQLPEPADVSTQALIGNLGSSDGVISILNDARRHLREGALAIPRRCVTQMAAVRLPEALATQAGFAPLPAYYTGKVFEKVGRRFDIRLCVRNFPSECVISDVGVFEDLDFTSVNPVEDEGDATLAIAASAPMDGLLLWTRVIVDEGIEIDYLSNQQAWLPVYLPVAEPGIPVSPGARVQVRWKRRLSPNGINPDYEVTVSLADAEEISQTFHCRSRHAETDCGGTALHRRLLATVGNASSPTVTSLRAFLATRLPEPMLPAQYVWLDALPRNANGKLDRAGLPAPRRERPRLGGAPTPPATVLERELVTLWEELLGIEGIGIDDDFFELGGDSLRAISMTGRLQQLLGEPVYVVVLFDSPTVARLAAYLEAHFPEGSRRIGQSLPTGGDALRSDGEQPIGSFEVAQFRDLLGELPSPSSRALEGARNPSAVFLLSTHRSGSTLLRVMLAGNPGLFAPPEFELLPYETLAERHDAFAAREPYWLEGTIHALMSVNGWSFEEAAGHMADCERSGMTVKEFYRQLQQLVAPRRLVDKSTHYSHDPGIIRRAELYFEEALYIHLVRHPCGMIRSYDAGNFHVFFRHSHPFAKRQLAELNWVVANQNILDFLSHVPQARQTRVRFEELVEDSAGTLERLSQFLGVAFHPEMLNPYGDARVRMTDSIRPGTIMLGDPSFRRHAQVDRQVARGWRGVIAEHSLGDVTWDLARRLGYERSDNSSSASRSTVEAASLPPLELIRPDPSRRHEPFPLTDVQAAYWAGREAGFELGNVATHVYEELDCQDLDLARLEGAWQQVVARHDMLRAIVNADGQLVVLEQTPPYTIAVADGRQLSEQEVTAVLERHRREMSHTVRQGDQWPPFDIRAVRLDARRTRLFLSYDVMFVDGWSRTILLFEWKRWYDEPAAALPPLELTFRDCSLALDHRRSGVPGRRARDYWTARIPNLPGGPQLPLVRDPLQIEKPEFRRREARLERAAWMRLQQQATNFGLTPTTIVLTAFADVLALWSQSPHFTLNVSTFNRPPLHPQVREVVGDFTSVTLLEVEPGGDGSFQQRGRRLQRRLWQDREQGAFSGIEVLRALRQRPAEESFLGAPIVFTGLLWGQTEHPARSSRPWMGKRVFGVSQTPQVWLDCVAVEDDGALCLIWDSVDALFPEGLLDDMLQALQSHLARLADDEAAWQAAPWETAQGLLPVWQRELFLAANDTAAPLPLQRLHDPFVSQAQAQPERIALISSTINLSYGELQQRSLAVAARLAESGIKPGDLVPIVMEKGWEQVVAVLGVLQAGGAYVPIDANTPPDRLQTLWGCCQARVALTQARLRETIPWPATAEVLVVERDQPPSRLTPVSFPETTPESTAYVIFTSGSTGQPKGVKIDHRGALNTILDVNRRYGAVSTDRVLALSSLSFDLSVYDLFGSLAVGGTIVLPEPRGVRDPAHWVELIEHHAVTIWNSVPALMQILVEYLAGRGRRFPAGLRLALLSGDWIPVALPDQVRALGSGIQVISLGGATEASIWSIAYPIGDVPPDWTSIPYGQPLDNQRFHVLSESLLPCPVWSPGGLYIAGAGLALGYWGDAPRTSEAFFVHPHTDERLYRTGDMGRYLPDGNIAFLGRRDGQVKIQGYRTELGEIESVLAQSPGVGSVAVAAVGDRQGEKSLVAFVVFGPGIHRPTPEQLRQGALAKLPEYMVPTRWVVLDELPLTANGKVDRRKLLDAAPPQPEQEHPGISPAEDFLPQVAQIVAAIVGDAAIHPNDNLLQRGATSLHLIRIVNRIETAFGGHRPAIDALYREPTIAWLARDVAHASRGGSASHVGTAKSLPRRIRDPQERDRFKLERRGGRKDLVRRPFASLPIRETIEEARTRHQARSSQRHFAGETVSLSALGRLLEPLRCLDIEGRAKYRYPSAGGLYPVRLYVLPQADRVEGLGGAPHYYDPHEHRLMQVGPPQQVDFAALDPLINGAVLRAAGFALIWTLAREAIEPLYGEESERFALLECGATCQLLEMQAARCGLGLCQIGSPSMAELARGLSLTPREQFLHLAVGGAISTLADRETGSL